MARPQQQELARAEHTPVDPDSASERAQSSAPRGRDGLGPVPPGNRPGSHPSVEQDKPAFATGDKIDLLRRKRGGEQVTFNDVCDHIVDYEAKRPEDAAVMQRFASFLARVEDVDHDHDGGDGGLNEPIKA